MGTAPNFLPCDGCGLPASPQHIAERLRRLELSTRFRPVRISLLFIALAPAFGPQNDFYGAPESNPFFDSFLEALDISAGSEKLVAGSAVHAEAPESARLAEFQRRGYFLAYLSECPIAENGELPESTIARLSPTLLRRIRFNYKPKNIAPLGSELFPLVEKLRSEGLGPILTLDQGQVLPTPRTGDQESMELVRGAVATVTPRDYLSSGYDRIQITEMDRNLGAGGNS